MTSKFSLGDTIKYYNNGGSETAKGTIVRGIICYVGATLGKYEVGHLKPRFRYLNNFVFENNIFATRAVLTEKRLKIKQYHSGSF